MHILHKFDQRAKPGLFIGYPFGKKRYRIYDLHFPYIYVSRDVMFHESVFPYRDLHPSSSIQPLSIMPLDDTQTN